MQNKPRGGYRAGAGRPRKGLAERVPRSDGKLAFWISVEHAGRLQQLMTRIIPDVNTPEQMIEHLIDQALHEPDLHREKEKRT